MGKCVREGVGVGGVVRLDPLPRAPLREPLVLPPCAGSECAPLPRAPLRGGILPLCRGAVHAYCPPAPSGWIRCRRFYP